MCRVVPEDQLRERVTTFAVHAGLLYALMGSASVAGVLFDPCSASAAAAAAAAAAATASDAAASAEGFTATAAACRLFGVGAEAVREGAVALTSACFVVSAALNIYGLLNSMLIVGRVNVLPDSVVARFLLGNPVAVHSVGWCLIPSAAFLCAGLVCAVQTVHGEPAATIAAVAFTAAGVATSVTVATLGVSTEALSAEVMRAAARSKKQT